MKPRYKDITSRLGEPKWWDEHGVPRYDDFSPEDVDIYAKVVVLLVIECQHCHKQMRVAASWDIRDFERWKQIWAKPDGWKHLYEYIESGPYGDPPEHDDLCGETMSSIPIYVLEFWHNEDGWKRITEFDGPVKCPWWEREEVKMMGGCGGTQREGEGEKNG